MTARKGKGGKREPARGSEAAMAAGDHATRLDWPSGWIAAAIYLGAAVLYFLPAFLPGKQVYGSDFLAGGFPFHEFISDRFADGALPKWVPYVYGGVPIFANPGSTYHPFRFLADVLFDPSRIFPAIYVLQFALAGLGAFLLSREIGCRRWVAFVAGLAFQFTGLMMSYVLAGHEGRIIVATLTPLVLFFLHRGVRTGALVWFAGVALALGSALISFQIQSSYYLLLLGLAWGIFAIVKTGIRGWKRVSGRLAMGLGAVVLAFAMAAVNFLPFLDYVEQSPRGGGGRGYEYATSWDMPPEEISGLVLPERAGILEAYEGSNPFKLHTEYVGVVVLLLVALGAYFNRRDRYWWFFLGATLIALSFSFGGNTPIYRLYYELLPGTRRFRAPSISFFVVSASLVMMAALTLERLAALREQKSPEDDTGIAGYVLGALSGAALVLLLASAGGEGEHGRQLAAGSLRVALVTWIAGGVLWAWLRRSVPTAALVAALAVVTVADLWVVDRKFFETVDGPEFLYARNDVVDFLESQPGRDRIWVLPPEFQGGQGYGGGLKNYLMYYSLDQTAGEHGNQLQRYNQFLGAGERTYVDWHNVMGDLRLLVGVESGVERATPNFLAAGNIRYIVSMVQLPGLPLVFQGRSGLVYEVPGVLPRAYVVGEAIVAEEEDGALDIMSGATFDPTSAVVLDRQPERPSSAPGDAAGAAGPGGPAGPASIAGPATGEAAVEAYEPDRVLIRASTDREALLVLADNYYEGWEATVDGEPVPVYRANHAFRAVPLPAGEHQVEFVFRPGDVYRGLAVSLVALLLALGVVGASLYRHRTTTRGTRPSPAT